MSLQKLRAWLQSRQKWQQLVAFNLAIFALLCVTKKLSGVKVKLQSTGNEESNLVTGLIGANGHTALSYDMNLNVREQFHLNIFDYDSFKTAQKEDVHESGTCVQTSLEVIFLKVFTILLIVEKYCHI